MSDISGDDMDAGPIRRAWHAVADNLAVEPAIYMGLAGVAAYTFDADDVEKILPSWLVHLWAVALILGALAVVAGTITRRTRVETMGHYTLLWGLVVLTVSLPQVWLGALLLGVIAAKRLRILHRARRAQREAAQILNRDAER